MNSPSKLAAILHYGPIVFIDEDLQILFTINGSYLNLWTWVNDKYWSMIDCRYSDIHLDKYPIGHAIDRAKAWAKEIYQDTYGYDQTETEG